MEGVRGNVTDAAVDIPKINSVTGQEACTMLGDGSFSSVETSEKDNITTNGLSTLPHLEQLVGDKEKKCSSELSSVVSLSVSSAEADESEFLAQEQTTKERIETETDVEKQDNKDDQLVSASQQKTQAHACIGGESDVDGKTSLSCETDCNGDKEMTGKTLQESDETDDCLLGKVVFSKLEHAQICMNQTTSEQPQTESSVDGCLDSINCQMEKRALNGQTHDHEQPTEDMEVKMGTGYLDGVISSIQSLPCNQPEGDRDTVQISRAELTVMVEQTLAAQTMCNYMQDLVQKNKMLNKQNEVLKDTIVQTRKWGGEEEEEKEHPQSLPVNNQGKKAQVFQFPGSLPPVLVERSSSSSQGPSCPPDTAEQSDDTGGLQTDGDLTSASLQLSSQIFLDGDTIPEISAAGQGPLNALNSTASGASVPAQGGFPPNIPNAMLLDEAHVYSMGPQQCEESVEGCVGVSPERFKHVVDELEKMRRFVRKIITEAGIHPDNVQELLSLRDKVKNLQEENSQLMLELKNRPESKQPVMMCREQEEHSLLLSRNSDLEQKVQDQKIREDKLIELLGKIGTENKMLKAGTSRPQSQPPSNVGLQALPPISHISVGCQTAELYQGFQEYATQLAHLQAQLVNLSEQLAQAKNRNAESALAMDTLYSEVLAKDKAISDHKKTVKDLQQRVQELAKRCEQLAQQMIALNHEHEEQKRQLSQGRETIKQLEKLCQETKINCVKFSQDAEKSKKKRVQELDRNKQLEKMIEDERRRYARDEKELLDRVKLLTEMTRDVELLKRLILTVDKARQEGSPLSQECTDMLAALWRHDRGNVAAAAPTAAPTVRPSSSWSNVSGPPPTPSGSRLQQPRSFSGNSHAGQANVFPPRGGGQQGSGHRSGGAGGGSGGRGSHTSSNISP